MSRGFPEALGLLDRLSDEGRDRLRDLLEEFGPEISVAQKAAAPSATGQLKRALGFEVDAEALSLKSGLLGVESQSRSAGDSIIADLMAGRTPRIPRSFGKVYYGRFVEFGRRAQTVQVIRGTSASTKSYTSRKRRESGLGLRKPYTLRVPGMAARPFVALPDIEARADRRLAEFWSEALPA